MIAKTTKKKNKKHPRRGGVAVLIAVLAVVCIVFAWALSKPESGENAESSESMTETTAAVETGSTEAQTKPAAVEEAKEVSINLGSGMRILDVGKYTGVYMEDGSDEILTGVMMITVANEGENDIQYAEISMPAGDRTASFVLTTLPAGSTVVLLELNRMDYVPGDYITAVAENVALFREPLNRYEDRLEIQGLPGTINVSNISDEDISGEIVIYYKNSAADVYYGGITYRVRLEGGLKAGEVRQITANHFSPSGSTVMFVTCGEN